MNDDKIRISPDALITMIVTEAQNRELAQMPSLEEMNEAFHPSEKFLGKMDSLVRETKSKAKQMQKDCIREITSLLGNQAIIITYTVTAFQFSGLFRREIQRRYLL